MIPSYNKREIDIFTIFSFEFQCTIEYCCSILIFFTLMAIGLKIIFPFCLQGVTSHINGAFPRVRHNMIYYYAHHGVWPDNNKELSNFLKANEFDVEKNDRYIDKIDINNGAIHFIFGNALPGKTLTLRPVVPVENPLGPVNWVCGNKENPSEWIAFGVDQTNLARKSIPKYWLK